MKYILINIIVLLSFLEATEKIDSIKKEEFIYIKPISIEYNKIVEELVLVHKEDTVSEDEEDEAVASMWANASDEIEDAIDDREIDDEKIEEGKTQELLNNSVGRCERFIKGFTVDKEGCPQTYRLQTKFQGKSFDTVAQMSEELKEFSSFLKRYTSYQVIIYSYTDSIGDDDSNKKLTEERARAIRKLLLNLGVSSTKLTAIGKGEKEPLDSNMYMSGRDKNNRIEIELIY